MPSLGLGLAALLAAGLALGEYETTSGRPLAVWDRSLSNRFPAEDARNAAMAAALERFRAGQSEVVQLVEVGSLAVSAAEADLFDAVRQVPGAAPVLVLTDRPVPVGLPAGVDWQVTPASEENAAILDVFRRPDGEWWMSWSRWGRPGPIGVDLASHGWMMLESDPAGYDLPVAEGLVQLGADPGRRLSLTDANKLAPDDRPLDDAWTLPADGEEAPPPRPPEECRPAPGRTAWPQNLAIGGGHGGSAAFRALAGLAAVFLVLALLARRCGR